MNAHELKVLQQERGIVLILAMLVMLVMSILGLAFLSTAKTEDTIAANYRNHTAAFYAAEGGVESGVASLKALLATTPTPTEKQLTDIPATALTNPDYQFDAFRVARVRSTPPYSYLSSVSSGPSSGLNAVRTDYVVTAQVTGPRGSRAQVSQAVQYMQIPLFQFAVFYGRGVDLEITPAPPMIIKGRVHANSNIYTLARSSLHYEQPMTTSGHIYRYIKRDPSDRDKNPMIKAADGTYKELNFDYEYGPGFGGSWTPDKWKAHALATFGGTVQDKEMGIKDLNLPLPDLLTSGTPDVVSHQIIEKGSAGDSQALKDAKLYYQADLRIVNGVATLKDGSAVTLDPGVITTKFWDARQQTYMTVSEVNVERLNENLVSLFAGPTEFNGILYVSNDAPDTGVRLAKGEQLPPGGLTVVSEKPVYILGDYNTVNKVPAAVLGDAITVLSNSWEKNGYDADGKAKGKYTGRAATETTVNAAFALGPSKESTVGQGNGQLENVIRFLENWDGKNFDYTGSILSLWHSQHAQKDWTCCPSSGFYKPPNRNWAFDKDFLTNPPPGTPMVIEIARGGWSQM